MAYKSTSRLYAQNSRLDLYLMNISTPKLTVGYRNVSVVSASAFESGVWYSFNISLSN